MFRADVASYTLNLLGALRLVGNAPYLQAFEADSITGVGQAQIAATFDDYYVGLPFFGLAATVCGLVVAQIEIYSKRPSCLRRGVVGMVRDLRLCFSDFSWIRQAG